MPEFMYVTNKMAASCYSGSQLFYLFLIVIYDVFLFIIIYLYYLLVFICIIY